VRLGNGSEYGKNPLKVKCGHVLALLMRIEKRGWGAGSAG